MKVFLMFSDKNISAKGETYYAKDDLVADLELEPIISCMAQKDETIKTMCRAALFSPLKSADEIRYRQENLKDALQNPDAVRQLYDITVETEKKRKKAWLWLSSMYLSSTFSNAVDLVKLYTEMLRELRLVADRSLPGFRSDGFRRLLAMFQRELDDDYFQTVRSHLESLRDSKGMLISSKLGSHLQGVGYVLRRNDRKGFWTRWRFAPSYTIAPRDDAGATDLVRRCDRAINEATNALAQAAEHLEDFFAVLRGELAFYVGCLNLADQLRRLDMPVCMPELLPQSGSSRNWKELYDISLALTKNGKVVGNDLNTGDKRLYIITGANQGGKTTFLRSIGQAQLMAQCGMFVGAGSFAAPVRPLIFTHFKKEEDSAMKSGKLDEELLRMSRLADHLESGALMLFNESFAVTNEREGSEICRQITQALIENGVEVFSVTHLDVFAEAFLEDRKAQYLRAQRLENGERTFKIIPGEPLRTAYGEDLYRQIFATAK